MKSVHNIFTGVRDYLAPVLSESAFATKGVLTPEEFVQAGDQLVYKCPTWRWEAGEESMRKPYLPPNKQYLITTNVPSHRRVSTFDKQYANETEIFDEYIDNDVDGWLSTNLKNKQNHLNDDEDEIEEISCNENDNNNNNILNNKKKINILKSIQLEHFASPKNETIHNNISSNDENEIIDINLMEENDENIENLIVKDEEDEANMLKIDQDEIQEGNKSYNDNILYTRRYDVSIVYDKYYQTPHVYLFGYFEKTKEPLTPNQIFEDVMQDYAKKTVTIESHPHHLKNAIPHASIHPCQHANTMKRIIDNMHDNNDNNNDKIRTYKSHNYLFIFLKFIQSVIPTIDYDHTIHVDFNTT